MVKCDWCGVQAVALPDVDQDGVQTGRIILPRGWWAVADGWKRIHGCSLECKSKLAALREKGQPHD